MADIRLEGQWSTNPFDFGCRLVPTSPLPVFDRTTTAAVRVVGNAGGASATPPGCSGLCFISTARPVEAGVVWVVPPS